MGAAGVGDDEVFGSLVARLAADRRWMRRVRRHMWWSRWTDSLLEVSLVWGVLGPVGTIAGITGPTPVADDVPARADDRQ